ncbi:MAG: hypothetical protein AB7V46_23085 [Thermomicrobiales bacterium]
MSSKAGSQISPEPFDQGRESASGPEAGEMIHRELASFDLFIGEAKALLKIRGDESAQPKFSSNRYMTLKRKAYLWLAKHAPGPHSRTLAHDHVYSGKQSTQLNERLVARFGPANAERILTAVTEAFPFSRWRGYEEHNDIDNYARTLAALEREWRSESITAEIYANRRMRLKADLRRWLNLRLADRNGEGPDAHDFIYFGHGRTRIVWTLSARFGEQEAARIITALDQICDALPGSSIRRTSYVDQLLDKRQDLTTEFAQGGMSRRDFHERQRWVKRRLETWLKIHLNQSPLSSSSNGSPPMADGSATGANAQIRSAEKMVRDFMYEGTGRKELMQRLSERFDPDEALAIVGSVERLVAGLPRKSPPLQAHLATASELMERIADDGGTQEEVRHAQQRLRRRMRSWLAAKLGGADGRKLAAAFIDLGREKEEVLARLEKQFGPEDFKDMSLHLEEAQRALAKLLTKTVEGSFPFAFKQRNLIRDFVPPGFTSVRLDETDAFRICDLLCQAIDTSERPELLSVFKKSQLPSHFVVFRDNAKPHIRGLANISNGKVAAVRTFKSPRH